MEGGGVDKVAWGCVRGGSLVFVSSFASMKLFFQGGGAEVGIGWVEMETCGGLVLAICTSSILDFIVGRVRFGMRGWKLGYEFLW